MQNHCPRPSANPHGMPMCVDGTYAGRRDRDHGDGRAKELLWKFASYNTCSMRKAGRWDNVVDMFSKAGIHAAGLQGTRDTTDYGLEYKRSGRYSEYAWGGQSGPYTNRHAGVAIMLDRRKFPDQSIKSVWEPPTLFAGRLGAVGTKTRLYDFTFFAVYTPPEPQTAQTKQVVVQTMRCLREFPATLPSRTFPIGFVDGNGHSGSYSVDGITVVPTVSSTVGGYNM